MQELMLSAIFLGAALLCALEPGPNFVLLGDETLRRGRASGWKAALGLHAGAWPHIILASAGLVTLLQLVPELLTVLKWIAAAMLLWFAYQTIAGGDTVPGGEAPSPAARQGAFRRGFMLVLLNPRTSYFFASFPLLFISQGASLPVAAQILVLGGLTNLVFLLVDIAFVMIVGRAGEAFDLNPVHRRLVRWLGGGLLAGYAARLATTRD
ncbi:LysE family translocator [Oricola sp.]|uniref:LysE family translocator n=1 Tax=Oricola sp. TaxID=1979950 RepID=UPI0025F77DD7|nr:LysE family translocator [Oricola sp.]MCI5078468.1 LysE family translocator [Oricola sp.]